MKSKLLSIGICTLEERKELLDELLQFIEKNTPKEYMEKIEIITNIDNGEKSVGKKRNEILKGANGKFISFIDDDDLISKNYIVWIINAIENKKDLDCIGITGKYYIKRVFCMVFKHSKTYGTHFKDNNGVQCRPCNHLNPVRTSIAKKIGFIDKNYGEDSDYSDRLLNSELLKTEIIIEPVIYHYFFHPEKSKTHTKENPWSVK